MTPTNKTLWELRNCDAIKMLSSLPDGCADMVLTDPPYQVSRETGFKDIGTKGVARFGVSMDFGKWDSLPEAEHLDLLNGTILQSYRILRPGGVAIVFYDMWKMQTLSAMLQGAGFRMLRMLEWLKTNPVPLNSKRFYLSNGREVAIACVKGSKPTFNGEYMRGVFEMPIHRDGGKRLHPTQKPLALMRLLIEMHTAPNDLVVDPFAGSATTLVAATAIGRRSMGSELDPKYFGAAKRRLANE
jgi:site-specific DNA-methyltransferase (adenine-specific)